MHISLADSQARGFMRWSTAQPPCGDGEERAGGDAPIVFATPDTILVPPEQPHPHPWMVRGAAGRL